MNPIVQRNPADLKPHKLVKDLPAWADADPRFHALCDDVGAQGVLEPLLITERNEVVDGRHRMRAARKMAIDVPCVVIPDGQVAEVALSTLLHRRHYTAGQLAYMALPLMQPAFDECRRRQLAGKKPDSTLSATLIGGVSNSVGKVSESMEDWSATIGISKEYIRIARKVRDYFFLHSQADETFSWNDAEEGQKLTFRQYFEPQILAAEDPIGLGAVVRGIEAKLQQKEDHGGGRPTNVQKQLELFADAFGDLRKRFVYWTKFKEPEKLAAKKSMATTVESMPDDLLSTLGKQIKAEVKRRKKTAPTTN